MGAVAEDVGRRLGGRERSLRPIGFSPESENAHGKDQPAQATQAVTGLSAGLGAASERGE